MAGWKSSNQFGISFQIVEHGGLGSNSKVTGILTALKAAGQSNNIRVALRPAITWYIEKFNAKIPEAMAKVMHMRSGKMAQETKLVQSGATGNRWVLRVRSTNRGALVQQYGRPISLSKPTIEDTSSGRTGRGRRSFKIGGGSQYWVPLKSAFGNQPRVDPKTIHDLIILEKVFSGGAGGSYLIAGKRKSYAARSMMKRRSKDRSQGVKRRDTFGMFKPMFAIYVGPKKAHYTGIAGYSNSQHAKGGRSPGRWFDQVTYDMQPDFLNYINTEGSQLLKRLPIFGSWGAGGGTFGA